MAKLEKLKVCFDLCYPSIGKKLHAYFFSSKKGSIKKKYLFRHVTEGSDQNSLYQRIGTSNQNIVREPTTVCALSHICSRLVLEELSKEQVNLQTANKVLIYWKKSILAGESSYSELLSLIRSLILADVQKQKALKAGPSAKMEEIIRLASNAIYG